jgi:hypothetical protein
MKGYQCHKCGAELHYEQICGMRILREIEGRKCYSAYCPVCKEYFTEEKLKSKEAT